MTAEKGWRLHPLAAQDITEIWEKIAEKNPLAARRVREEILIGIRALTPFPNVRHKAPTSPASPYASLRYVNI
jgi:plasmid stabilization system protein ParE